MSTVTESPAATEARPAREVKAEARFAHRATLAMIDEYRASGSAVHLVWADALEDTLDALEVAAHSGHDAPTLADHVSRYEAYREMLRQDAFRDAGHRAGYRMGRAERGVAV